MNHTHLLSTFLPRALCASTVVTPQQTQLSTFPVFASTRSFFRHQHRRRPCVCPKSSRPIIVLISIIVIDISISSDGRDLLASCMPSLRARLAASLNVSGNLHKPTDRTRPCCLPASSSHVQSLAPEGYLSQLTVLNLSAIICTSSTCHFFKHSDIKRDLCFVSPRAKLLHLGAAKIEHRPLSRPQPRQVQALK